MASGSDINLYGQLYQEIASRVLGSSSAKLQLVYPFLDCTWDNPRPPAGYIDSKCYDVIGQMPSYSAIGSVAPETSTSLYDAYRRMLLLCPKLTVPDERMQELSHIQDEIDRVESKCKDSRATEKTADEEALITKMFEKKVRHNFDVNADT